MKIAITNYNKRVSPVFDVCGYATIFEVNNRKILAEENISLSEYSPVEKLTYLLSFGVHTLICGAISYPVFRSAKEINLQVIPFVSGEVSNILTAFLKQQDLHSVYSMPGCGRGMFRRRQRGIRCARNFSEEQLQVLKTKRNSMKEDI